MEKDFADWKTAADKAKSEGKPASHAAAREPRQHDGRQRPAGQYLQWRAQADDRLRHSGRHLVPGRIERGPRLSVSRPVPADDQELARRMGPGRLLVLLGPACRLPGRNTRTGRERLGRAARGPDHDHEPSAQHGRSRDHRHRRRQGHPPQEQARRRQAAGALALAHDYGVKVAFQSPTYKAWRRRATRSSSRSTTSVTA